MRTLDTLRGQHYPGYLSLGCTDYNFDAATQRCRSFNPSRCKCLECEHTDFLNDNAANEDRDLKLMAQQLKVVDRQRRAVHQYEGMLHQTLMAGEYNRLGPDTVKAPESQSDGAESEEFEVRNSSKKIYVQMP